MGYHPNPAVSELMAQVRQRRVVPQVATIAHITEAYPPGSWRTYPFTGEIILGAEERAKELGYKLEEFSLKEPGMTARRLSDILRARGIRGVLIGKRLPAVAHMSLTWEHFAAVTTSPVVRQPALHRVLPDCVHAARLAMRQLRHLGYRRIGFVTWREHDKRNDGLYTAGILRSQQELPAIERVPMLIAPKEDARPVFVPWLRKHRLDAVLGCNFYPRHWLEELGYRVPQDVGFASVLRSGDPRGCAHIDHQGRVIGAAAIDLLIAQLHRNETGLPAHPQIVLIRGGWVAGKTLAEKRKGISAKR
jgi:LacI family transcriptional regulator